MTTRDEMLTAAARCAPRGKGFDRCIPTVDAIVARLGALGVAAKPMRLKGARDEMPDADRRWRAVPRHAWIHYVAWIPDEGVAIDATGAQFGLPALRAITRAEAERDWDEVLVS